MLNHIDPNSGDAEQRRPVCCSFCLKGFRLVGPLIEGPDRNDLGKAYICRECAELCLSILETEKKRNELRRDEATTIQPDLPPLPPEMEEFLKPLTDEEREITKLRHGLADGCHYTFEEVGRMLKMTLDDVQEIATRAETKLVSQNTPNKNLSSP
jgi:DNA-directed RNA polymerase specialized sigma24 family protein